MKRILCILSVCLSFLGANFAAAEDIPTLGAPTPPKESSPQQAPTEPALGAFQNDAVAAPAPTQQAAADPLLDGIVLPGIMDPLLRGDLEKVPDDRTSRDYVFSVLAAIAQLCGDRDEASSMVALGYVEPGLAPGRDIAQFGLEKGMEYLLKLGQAAQSGDIRDFAALGKTDNHQIKEGLEDGALIVSRLQCQSNEFRRLEGNIGRLMAMRSGSEPQPLDTLEFQALMSPAYRAARGIADPGPALQKRQIERSMSAFGAQCTSRYASDPFCSCIAGRLKDLALPVSDWAEVGADFDAIVALGKRSSAVRETVNACVKG